MPTLRQPSKRKKKRDSTFRTRKRIRQKIYNNKLWRELRQQYIQEHPLCEQCLREGRVTPAEDVHHVVSFMTEYHNDQQLNDDMLKLAFDYDNLMSLCRECHLKAHGVRDKRKYMT